MADGMQFTPGSGDTAAADDCGASGKVALGKLAYSADGVATLITADASGLMVNPSNQKAATATLANVSDTTSSTALIASNSARKGFMIYNDSAATLYVNFGATASSTAFTVKIPPDGYYESGANCYTGVINGIWSADLTGAARVTELT